MRAVLLAAALGLMPRAAAAHAAIQGVGDFYAGAFAPLSGPADVLAWLALSGLAALHAQRVAGWAAEAFGLGLAGGILLARALHLGPPPELAEAGVLLTLGGLIALGRAWPGAALFALAGGAGVLRGAHAGADLLDRPDGVALAAGAALAGYVLVAVTTAALCWVGHAGQAEGCRPGWRLIALRAAGSWISAIALMVGAFALR